MGTNRKYSDPQLHARYRPFVRSRNQAAFRNEEWLLSFEEYCEFWTWDLWVQRGRKGHQLVLTRKDRDQPWTTANCMIVTRGYQVEMQCRKFGSFKRKDEPCYQIK